jgi:hypothetical protein
MVGNNVAGGDKEANIVEQLNRMTEFQNAQATSRSPDILSSAF